MLKPYRTFVVAVFFLIGLIALPVSSTLAVKQSAASVLQSPIRFSKGIADWVLDLFHFRRNAEENRTLKRESARQAAERFEAQELRLENARLTKLLDLKPALPSSVKGAVFSRVIARSPSAWNRVFLIDKGTLGGVKTNGAVLSDFCLVGKIMEAGPSVSKVLLITDPNCKIGVLVQKTRQQGVLFGTLSGECRVKYLSLDAGVKPGDVLETAGFDNFFPKGLRVGTVSRVWKEPGQMYRVAAVRPLVDLDRIEEVACVE